jgi:hypothetical protein
MSILSSPYPRQERTGAATATAGVNDFTGNAVDKKTAAEKSVFFINPSTGKISGQALNGKHEKARHVFSPFGGSWDYSEVD